MLSTEYLLHIYVCDTIDNVEVVIPQYIIRYSRYYEIWKGKIVEIINLNPYQDDKRKSKA
jgi:hypothetical protein